MIRLPLGLSLLACTAIAAAQTMPMTPDIPARFDAVTPQADYVRREVMIPMRDGKRMFAVIVMRKGVTNAPILLTGPRITPARRPAVTRARRSRRYCRSPTPSS